MVGHLASGAIAGCAVEAALYPLDTIKTRLQMMRSGGGISALLKSGGGKALYAGIGCALHHSLSYPFSPTSFQGGSRQA